jgi:uncharacterized membrane protein YqjE
MAAQPGAGEASSARSLLRILQGVLQELPGLISDRVDLLSLELSRAARALAQIVALVLVAVIVCMTAWLALWVVLAVWLRDVGWPDALVLLLVVAANLLAATLVLWRVLRLLPMLRLPATRRHLMFGHPSQSPLASSPAAGPSDHASTAAHATR